MAELIDLTGQDFQGCKVIARAGTNKNGIALWECICVCGRTVIKRGDNLRRGQTKCQICAKGRALNYLREGRLIVRKFTPNEIKPKKAMPCEKCGADSIPFSKVLTKENKKYNRLCRPCFVNVC